jgi:hypothetical protein
MGQAIRMMSYSQSKNIDHSTQIPSLIINNAPLNFYKLDDGVMGGQSQTHLHKLLDSNTSNEQQVGGLLFTGEINTNGGGFTSIRTALPNGVPRNAKGLKLKYKGDGKTYKVLLSDGKGGGPFSSSPTWQCDLPTTSIATSDDSASASARADEECILYFKDFIPSFGGRGTLTQEQQSQYTFLSEEMKQMGFMLSLKLSNGDANPIDTFGSGIFGFELRIHDVELV